MPEPEMGKRPYMSLAVGAMPIPHSPCLKREPEPMRAIIMGAPLLIWQPRTAELSIPLSCNSCDNPPGFRLDFKHSFRLPLGRTIIQFESKDGDPDRTRTCYLEIRNLALYPDELRGRNVYRHDIMRNNSIYPFCPKQERVYCLLFKWVGLWHFFSQNALYEGLPVPSTATRAKAGQSLTKVHIQNVKWRLREDANPQPAD